MKLLAPLLAMVVMLTSVACHRKHGAAGTLDAKETRIEVPGVVKAQHEQLVYPVAGLSWLFKVGSMVDEGATVDVRQELVRFEGDQDQKRSEEIKQNLLQAQKTATDNDIKLQGEQATLKKEIEELKNQVAINKIGKSTDSTTTEWTISARDRVIAQMDDKIVKMKLALAQKKLGRMEKIIASSHQAGQNTVAVWQQSATNADELVQQNIIKAEQRGTVVYKRSPWEHTKPKVGANVFVGMPVMGVYDSTQLYVEAYIPEKLYAVVKNIDQVMVNTMGSRQGQYTGKVTQVSQAVMKVGDWEQSVPLPPKTAAIRAFKATIKMDEPLVRVQPDDEVRVDFMVSSEKEK